MMTHPRLRRSVLPGLALIFVTALPAAPQTGNLSEAVPLREIGPTPQGGRYVDYAVVESRPQIFYAATASGGLWKTDNHGQTWTSVFDNQPVFSIGAVALSQLNPDIVYVGTGEGNNSRSSYWGNGVYRSDDGGSTWRHLGLDDSGHIGRVVIHPTDPNTVWVAALGHLYSQNPERGLYMTTDGGTTWTKTLDHRVDGREIGVVDVAIDPSNPDVLYAATYDKVRLPWTFAEGGQGSRLFRSEDGGRTWTQLTNGLPDGMIGRIGIGVARSQPNTVYAIIENAATRDTTVTADERRRRLEQGFGGNTIGDQLYRSDDAGTSWRKVAPADDAPANQRFGGNPPYYYGQVRVDPNDPEHVYILSVAVTHTTDGGATWERPFPFGGDHHGMWINPQDSRHMILGHDHGMGITFDAGATWYRPDNKPLAQFYTVGYDMDVPYNVYGGTQDNGSLKGPSTKRGGLPIRLEDWYRVGGGDGMYNEVDPTDSRWLYNESQFGNISRQDQQTGETKSIRYRRAEGAEPLRWNWMAPILISPHDPDVIYHGAQVLLRSSFRGETWEEISPDLSVHDPARRDGTGNIQYATITTVDESPIIRGVIWVGTDDGNVQLTVDGGATWTNVRDRIDGHPGYWVSRVVASHHDAATAYVSVTGYRRDDFRPFVWKTTDYGQTWTSVAGVADRNRCCVLPDEPINVIREDRRNPDLLFVGTEMGAYATIDGGRSWTKLVNGMPTQPVHDLKIHPRDNEVIIATHGRGIFIGDISPLQQLTPAVLAADSYLFDIQPAIQWSGRQRPYGATLNFNGESRPTGVLVTYHLRRPVSGDVVVRVYDGARLIAELNDAPKTAGFHTVRWTMQSRRERTAAEPAPQGGFGGGGFGGAGGGGQSPAGLISFPAPSREHVIAMVPPGGYRVVLIAGGRELEKRVFVHADR